jgi:hypothetical protein
MRKISLLCATAALVSPVAIYAQETTSTIRGTVTAAGAPVAGAELTIVNVPTGGRSTVTTDENGGFSASGLRPGGPYTVTVNAPGFAQASITDINTVVAQAFELPIELTAAEADAPEIVVTAARLPGARTVSQGPATVLNAEQISNIATINRDIRDLSRRDPFARLDETPTGGRAVSFAGQNARFNRFSVDGVGITDNFGLNPDGLPSRRSPIPIDAIAQFQAKVAPYDVREGNFQGGAINIILKSGTNDFHGTGFYAFQSDELVGKETKPGPGVPTGRVAIPNFKIENYGAVISGPIIQDRLFFMVAGERLRGGRPIAEGPENNNAGISIPGLSQGEVDQISQIAQSRYSYDTGGVLRDLGDKDDRLVAKIDANISDTQRLSATYTYANDSINLLQNSFVSSPPGLGLASNAYVQGNRLHTGVVELNSEWSDEFSTQSRGFYKKYKRLQDPLLGRGFAQFRVCTEPTSDRPGTGTSTGTDLSTACANNSPIVSFGPDPSRQTNALDTETWGGLFQARLNRDDHDIRLFAEYQDVKIFNSFVQNTAGNYYFDSIADFQAGNAQSLTYGNAIPSLVPEDAAAKFDYQVYTFGAMDTWRIGPDLNVSYGARYDLYGGTARPAFNANFLARYPGFEQANRAIVSGRGLFQPRFGFDWRPLPRLSIRGGGGVFGGGTPDVYMSNSFSNTGILTNSVTIRQNNNNTFSGTGVTPAIGQAALVGVTGRDIPGPVNQLLLNATVTPLSTTNALDPNFKIPSQLRATLSADYEADLGPLGDGWRFGADVFYSTVQNQVFFTDIRSVPQTGANALTPDGRQRYVNLAGSATDTGTDILLTNTKRGRSYIGVARFDKSWDFGLNLYGSYTYQDVKDQAPATSSTAGSNYSNGAFIDPNRVAYGISNDEVRHQFKYGLTFERPFFGDFKTTIALFGESRSGHPFSYTFQDFGGTRSAVFGTTGVSTGTGTGGNRYLLYVPTLGGDSKVSYSSTAVQQAVENFIRASGLEKYAGGVAPRNAFRSKWFTKLDLHLSQELPTGLGSSRLKVFADIENFTNLINKNWGQIREYTFPYNVPVVRVQCLTTPVATGTTPTAAQIAANTGQACAQYRYSPVGAASAFSVQQDQIYASQSLYAVRLGVRFEF